MGDTVSVCPESDNTPLYVARVTRMWEDGDGRKRFHAHWFTRSAETVLGEAGDPSELFLADLCDDNPLGAIMDRINVRACLPPSLPPSLLPLFSGSPAGDASGCGRRLGPSGRGEGGGDGGGWSQLLLPEMVRGLDGAGCLVGVTDDWQPSPRYDEDTARFEDPPQEYCQGGVAADGEGGGAPAGEGCISCQRYAVKEKVCGSATGGLSVSPCHAPLQALTPCPGGVVTATGTGKQTQYR